MEGRFTEDEKKEIVEKLEERIESLKCPVCHNGDMVLMDSFLLNPMHKNLKESMIHVKACLPSVPLVCKNCGFISSHSARILDIMHIGNAPEVKDEKEEAEEIKKKIEAEDSDPYSDKNITDWVKLHKEKHLYLKYIKWRYLLDIKEWTKTEAPPEEKKLGAKQ